MNAIIRGILKNKKKNIKLLPQRKFNLIAPY